MNATGAPVTHYDSKSKGRVAIAEMNYPHLTRTVDLLERTGGGANTIAAMRARIAELDAMPDDAARIAATTPAIFGFNMDAPAAGHNAGPKLPTTFAGIADRINDLYGEAKNWLDGAAIANQPQADEVSRLRGMIKEAEAQADALRKAENEPFDTGKAAVQALYKPLIGKTETFKGLTVRAVEACNAALTPWLRKLDDELEAQRAEARRIADAKIEEVQTLAAAADASNLADREVVEEAVQGAKQAIREVKAVEDTRARAGGGAYRSTLLKDNWTATLTDGDAALAHYWKMRRGEVEAFLASLAAADAKATNGRPIPGFSVENLKRAA